MKKIGLGEVIKEERYNYLLENPIDIVNVKIRKKSMEMFIYLEAKTIVEYSYIKDIKEYFISLFDKFTINLNISYKIDMNKDSNQEKYIKNLKDFLKDSVPSSKSWVRDITYKFTENNLYIELPNEISLNSLKRQNILKKMKKKLKEELDTILEVGQNKCNVYDNSL